MNARLSRPGRRGACSCFETICRAGFPIQKTPGRISARDVAMCLKKCLCALTAGLTFAWGPARSAEPSAGSPDPKAAEVAALFQPPTPPGTSEPRPPAAPDAPTSREQTAAEAAAAAAAAARTDVANLPRGTALRMLGDVFGIPAISF